VAYFYWDTVAVFQNKNCHKTTYVLSQRSVKTLFRLGGKRLQ